MKRTTAGSFEWVYFLAVSLEFAAVLLRSLLVYSAMPGVLDRTLVLLAGWLILFISEPAISRRWNGYFPVYLVLQSALLVTLLFNPDPPDYFAILFAALSMRVMQHLHLRPGILCVALFTPVTAFPLVVSSGLLTGVAFSLIYTAANALFASFSLAARRADETRSQNQAMQTELLEANRRLKAYSDQAERLVVARERSHLARELHDSVTQTIFSMTLTTQSALILLEGNPARVKPQLDRITELANSALVEMQTLITELRPDRMIPAGLTDALRRNLAERHLHQGLSISLEVEGDRALASAEEFGLYRIAQEAINNIVKHSNASRACLHLHLEDPLWIEIEDNGLGFDPEQARQGSGVGLSGMRERAAEIGWTLRIFTSPGVGVRIRVQKGGSDGDER